MALLQSSELTTASTFLNESSQITDQIGNAFVLNLYARIREIEALARTMAALAETLPVDRHLVRQVMPPLLNFQNDRAIAGGGVWFEPFAFDPNRERQGFFWGRNAAGHLQFFDDYNQSEAGYHQEAWYVVGKCASPGQCLWSKAYMDPHSCELMITCTAPAYRQGSFLGVVTVDLKLEGLQNTVNLWQKKTGGYIVVLDYGNQFIAFPKPEWVKKTQTHASGKLTESFMTLQELVEKKPLFSPLLKAVQLAEEQTFRRLQNLPASSVETVPNLSAETEEISLEDEQRLVAILADPWGRGDRTDYLRQKFELEQDELLQEMAIASLFHVPEVYWKVFIVKPRSEITAATHSLIHADKMATLGQMVAGVAHEVNNPLNFVVGNLSHVSSETEDLLRILQLYQAHYPEPPEGIQQAIASADLAFIAEDLPKLIRSMKMGADRALEITQLLRNFSRLDDANRRTANLIQELENTLIILSHRLKSKRDRPAIQIVKNYQPIPDINCYPGLLNQVFMNLLVNAIDALEDITKSKQNHQTEDFCPTIWIRTKLIDETNVQIEISDNGPGISPERQSRLFEPFFTTKPRGKGTGLGLAICRQIVEQRHGGTLTCRSSPQSGTTFIVQLPLVMISESSCA
ncbi:MAG: hypothetical protein Fur0046_09120 [Cyanobacteria bacterium J069]|nr:MAG: sensor histidine kinase [Cyanobacteria bacterium J069]